MRRSGSSSSILRPKAESDGEPLSVTILNTEQIHFSPERFYMLSELELHGHSTEFLYEENGPDEEDNETLETEESSAAHVGDTSEEGGPVGEISIHNQTSSRNQQQRQHAPFIMLYLLWRPEMESPTAFAEEVLLTSVQKLDSLVDIVPSMPPRRSFSSMSLNNLPSSPANTQNASFPEPEFVNRSARTNSQDRLLLEEMIQGRETAGNKVYIVVDRVYGGKSTDKENDNDNATDDSSAAKMREFQEQRELAEKLARLVSVHPYLREVCEGITVGVSNDERAAPGLEAMMDALNIGAKDRRKFGNNSQKDQASMMGIVANVSTDLLGIQDPSNTDATSDVLQCRVCAEWNGMGTLKTFARRSHRAWRIAHDLSPDDEDKRFQTYPSSKPRRRQFLPGQRAGQYNNRDDDEELRPMDIVSALFVVAFWVGMISWAWEVARNSFDTSTER